jgi:hypothetical protein
MKAREIRWSPTKDAELRNNLDRGGIGFAECAAAIEEGRILDELPHPTRANQFIFVLEIDGYAYVVPFVQQETTIFLKTMFPSRKHAARYLGVRK